MFTSLLRQLPVLVRLLVPLPLIGCIGSTAIDGIITERPGRRGMTVVYEDPSFSIHSFPERWAQVDSHFVDSLHAALSHHRTLLSAPERKITIYAHTSESYDTSNGSAGLENVDEFSFDFICCDEQLAAHEMGHLVTYSRVGGQPRLFLNEGMAEFLADSYEAQSGSGGRLVPDYPCGSSRTIDSIWHNAGFSTSYTGNPAPYPMAAQFTAIAINRSSVDRYFESYYGPAQSGTSGDGDSLLRRFIGLGFADMELEMSRAGCQ
jgi:hypothetical protein